MMFAVAETVRDRYQVLTDNQWERSSCCYRNPMAVWVTTSQQPSGRGGDVVPVADRDTVAGLPEVFGCGSQCRSVHRRYAAEGSLRSSVGRLDRVGGHDGQPRSGGVDRFDGRTGALTRANTRRREGRVSGGMLSYEPADHSRGRSRGGLTTKAHLATDGNGRGLAVLITAGLTVVCPMMLEVLEAIAVPRLVGDPTRRNPDRVLADKAYSSAASRELLRGRPDHVGDPATIRPARQPETPWALPWTPSGVRFGCLQGSECGRAGVQQGQTLACCRDSQQQAGLYLPGGTVMALTVEWLKLLGDMAWYSNRTS